MNKSTKSHKLNASQSNGNSAVSKAHFNAPKATTEQLSLARLLNTSLDDKDYQHKVHQVQECTACGLDEAISALHDADNNVQRAIENLLDSKCDNEWQDTVTKKSKSRRQNDQKLKSGNAVLDRSKVGSSSSQNDKDVSSSSDSFKQKSKISNVKKNIAAGNSKEKNDLSVDSIRDRKVSLVCSEEIECWGIECGEWKGEAIEVVNSSVDIPKNIHEDTELLKLLTSESTDVKPKNEVELETVEDNPIAVEKAEEAASEPKPENQFEAVRAKLFSKYARSATPPPSDVPEVPVFFAPGARNTRLSGASGSTRVSGQIHLNRCDQGLPDSKQIPNDTNKKCDQVLNRNSVSIEQQVEPQDIMKTPSQCNYNPVMNNLLQAPSLASEQPYPTLQSNLTHKETFTKPYDHGSSQGRTQGQSVNNFDNSKSYNYNLLNDLPQNMKQGNLELQVGKSDAFTQSISSNQTEGASAVPYPMQPTKQAVSQPPQMHKPLSTMPPVAGGQSLPTTQQQMHPVMHPSLAPFVNHFQPNVSLLNLASSGPAAAPHMFDIDQLQALQQQRLLFEFQQSQHASQHAPPVTNDGNLPPNSVDVMSSSKSNVPMHAVTTPNVSSAFAFLPYSSGMVLMNGYTSAYLGQQQATGSQNQTSGHGGSSLAHPSNQQQYPKALNSNPNYTAYHNLRQTNFDEVGDMYYPNLAKQMGYKHNTASVQGFYSTPMQQQPSKPGGPELSLGNKLQQQVSGLPSTQQTPPPQQPQAPNPATSVQPQALYAQQPTGQYPYFPQQCMAFAAAAAAAAVQNQQQQQQQQQSQSVPSAGTPGSGSMVSMHPRPSH